MIVRCDHPWTGIAAIPDVVADAYQTARQFERWWTLAGEAKNAGGALRYGDRHVLTLAAMVSHYIGAFDDKSPAAPLVAAAVTESLGPIMKPINAVFSIRRAATQLVAGAAQFTASERPK
jgi:hypothetical protein